MIMTLLYIAILGAVSGWIANTIMKRDTSRLGKNIILGIVGSIVGGLIANFLGLGGSGALMGIIFAVIGACLVIWIADKISRK